MRTTISLDDDVSSLLEQEMRNSGLSFKQSVNYFLRIGLATAHRRTGKPFKVTPRPLGLPTGLSYDNVSELLEAVEGADHR